MKLPQRVRSWFRRMWFRDVEEPECRKDTLEALRVEQATLRWWQHRQAEAAGVAERRVQRLATQVDTLIGDNYGS